MTSRVRSFAAPLCVFALACGLYGFGASQREIWRTDEHRYAEIARVLTTPGASWSVMHLNGDPYAAKPPLYYWAAAALHGGLGLPLPIAAMLPSVFGSALAVALTFSLGRRMFGVAGGAAAAVVLGSAEMFVGLALRANLDALLTACTTAALYGYWRSEEARTQGGSGWTGLLLASAAAGLAILVKGPVGLAVPGVVVVGHRFLERGVAGLRDRRLVAALLVALLPAAAWLAFVAAEAGVGFASQIALGNGLGHALGEHGKLRPLWYYLVDFPSGFLPWVLLLPAAFGWWAHSRRRRGADFAFAWSVAPFVLFSLSPAKRHLYLLPLYPGAALLLGALIAESVRGKRT